MSSNSPAGADALDVHSLTESVVLSTVTTHARRLESESGIRAGVSRFDIGCAVVIVLLVGVPTSVLFGIMSLDQGYIWAIAAAVISIATVAICIRVLLAASRHNREAPELRYRLERFAADNELDYVPEEPEPKHPGQIFSRGQDRVAHNLIRWPGEGLEVANYSYVTSGYRGIRSVWQWGYATAQLDSPAPALLLAGKKNKGAFDDRITALFDIRTPTRLSTPDGGRFELWAWPRDIDVARRLFDESLLSQLAARAIDLEIVDGRVFLFSNRPLSTSDPDTWTWILETVQTIQDRVASS
ncbi:hypothetical protein ASE14_07870 [Agromyces sp. Root81]|uniref:hypothetical protein n=1 Tax=Agromyces sp. Root81 TaxID=1736601 RepID=UPI0006F41C40|nr:hypothetical protein [Agromyces sp. Root81]KRC60872.1 hypothetical protein ASE14_07870 [Agromyces sp. Root81]